MEDDLKILKVEYLSNHWSDLPQILTKPKTEMLQMKRTSHGRQPQNIKVEYLNNN